MNLFDINDGDEEKEEIVKTLFPMPGSKFKSLDQILPNLPNDDVYVEAYGGTGIILLNRKRSKLEIFNDRHSGITDFYICLQNPELFKQLKEKINGSIYGREMFIYCRSNWHTCTNRVDRAFMWYYMIMYSFGRIGRNFGRAVKGSPLKSIRDYLIDFQAVHERLNRVTIENRDALRLLEEYDSHKTVFYLDPPYISGYTAYKNNLSLQDHAELLDKIHSLHGFVALSGYSNELYDSYNWDDRITWEYTGTLDDRANVAGKNKDRKKIEEVLWIKEYK